MNFQGAGVALITPFKNGSIDNKRCISINDGRTKK